MATVKTLGIQRSVLVSKANPDYSDVQANEYILDDTSFADIKRLIMEFDAVSDDDRYTDIDSVTVSAYLKDLGTNYALSAVMTSDALSKPLNPSQTTWNTSAPSSWSYAVSKTASDKSDFALKTFTIPQSKWLDTLLHPLAIAKAIYDYDDFALNLRNGVKPYITVTYKNTEKPRYVVPILQSYVNRTEPSTFRWSVEWTTHDQDVATGPIKQTSYTFSWSSDYTYSNPEAATWHSTTVTSANMYHTVPANTFPAGTIYWKVHSYDGSYDHGESSVDGFTTADSYTIAYPASPVSTIIDNASEIEFTWTTSNVYGNEPTASDLQYSTDGATWSTLATISGSEKTHTEPASTFSPGIYYWRVRSYNLDNVASSWSSNAAFIFIAAPTVDGLSYQNTPYTTVAWQSSGQQAYEVFVDGVSQGVKFGTGKEYELPFYLEDGQHTLGVRVQNTLSLWSEINEGTVEIENDPGADTITLTGSFDVDAGLSWVDTGSFDSFQVYRDGKKIAETTLPMFTDRFVLGEHSYFVLHKLANGNYVKSNEVSATMVAGTAVIDTLRNPSGWVGLELTANDPDEQIFTYQRTASLRHFTGAEYPVLELSKFTDRSGNYDVAFKDPESARAFEDLEGKVVIIKSRGGNVMVGAMLQLQKRVADFFISYNFALQQIEWEDFVDESS